MHIIWYNLTLSIFTFYSLISQLFKTTVDNYFWGLTFSLSSFSHHVEPVIKYSHFSNLMVRPHENQKCIYVFGIQTKCFYMMQFLPMYSSTSDLLGLRGNFTVILSEHLILFFSSVMIKLCFKTRHVSFSSHSLWNVFYKTHHFHCSEHSSNSLFSFTRIS